MRSKSFPKWLRLVAAFLLLLTTFAAFPAQADEPVVGGLIAAGGLHTCALRPDGGVDCWGDNSYGQSQDQPGPYIQVVAGHAHTCALTLAGAVDCWGWNYHGQAEDQAGPYIRIRAGYSHTCALTTSGAVDCWGWNHFGTAEDQPGPYTLLGAGDSHSCALTPAGAVDCWGDNTYGQAEDQPGPYIEISAATFNTCALTPAGAVDCWGWNGYGQAQDQSGPYIQISTGYHRTCALTPAGTVDCWGDDASGADPSIFYAEVSVGSDHICALTSMGAVDCWGYNGYGQAEDQPGPYGAYQAHGDTTPPVVTVTGVTEGSTYILGAVPQAGCSTTDEGSGVAVEASLSLSGGNELGVGSFTATCSGALDNAGNPGNTAVIHYNVSFQFTGFLAPVDNLPIMNIAKAGQTIPLKWRLTDINGAPVTNLTDVTVTVTDLSCEAGVGGDSIEEYVASNSGLQNLGDGYYQWNWKTSTSYANSCKSLSLGLGEGSEHTALFQFRK